MRIDEILNYEASPFTENEGYTLRAYEMDPMYAMTPDGGIHQLNGKRHDAAMLPTGSVVLDVQEHDPGRFTYTLFVKTGEGFDIMDYAFESKGFLNVTSASTPEEIKAAFVEQAKHIVV